MTTKKLALAGICFLLFTWAAMTKACTQTAASGEAPGLPAMAGEEEQEPAPRVAQLVYNPYCIAASTPAPTRYDSIPLTENARDELAAIVYLEARGESAEGQQAVVEVILNRVLSPDFPDTVHDVLYDASGGMLQFATLPYIGTAKPGKAQYDAIDAALHGEPVLPEDVVYFSTAGENDRVWGKIGNHVFCYGYVWE